MLWVTQSSFLHDTKIQIVHKTHLLSIYITYLWSLLSNLPVSLEFCSWKGETVDVINDKGIRSFYSSENRVYD